MAYIIEIVLNIGWDKQKHFLFFFCLSFFLGMLILFISSQNKSIECLRILWTFLVLLGIVEEYRQYYLPNRNAEFYDAVANLVGISCGLFIPFLITYLNMGLLSKYISQLSRHLIELILIVPFFYGLWGINQVP